jgi:antitoxin component YwqK of YwqJK toxin-antitoxin module
MDGSVESDDFYLNGISNSYAFDFTPEGKISVRREFDKAGDLKQVMLYHPDGSPATIMKESGKKRIYESTFANKKIQSHFEILCGGYYGTIARYFPDGKPFYSYNLFNGKREGKFLYYDISNNVEREGNYIDGWAEGLWKGYENGKLDYVGRYLNNNFDSTWTYYENGKVNSTANYLRGERNGLSTFQNAEGGPASEKMYISGDLVAFRTMRADGTWSDWTKFTGNASIISYYPNGSKSLEEEYRNGYLNGTKRHYLSNGKVVSEYSFKHGDYEGPYTRYYPNGKVQQKAEYRNDEMHGKMEWFNEDGTLLKTENYNYGVRTGKATTYQKGVKNKQYTFWGTNVYE